MGEPNWEKLREIAQRAEIASQRDDWSGEKWRALLDEALNASNGHGELTEFLADYDPDYAR